MNELASRVYTHDELWDYDGFVYRPLNSTVELNGLVSFKNVYQILVSTNHRTQLTLELTRYDSTIGEVLIATLYIEDHQSVHYFDAGIKNLIIS